MAVVPIDGMVRVSWLTACSNVAAPTTTELNNGTAIEGYITPDGLDIGVATGKVNTSNLGSTFTTRRAGRKEVDIKLKMHHDGTSDVAFNLVPYRTAGFLAVRRGIAKGTAWTAAQVVGVYPVESGEAQEEKPAPDGTWDFMVDLFVTTDPNQRAVVA